MSEVLHPIQVVSRLTGLSPHVIRVWEKRYRAVTPGRTGTNRRLYSDAEVKRLQLMARAIRAGHKIGFIARLDTGGLQALAERLGVSEGPKGEVEEGDSPAGAGIGQVPGVGVGGLPGVPVVPAAPTEPDRGAALVREALVATRTFQGPDLLRVLEQGTLAFGQNGVLHRLICPLAQTLGDLWQKGELTAAHEHFASALIRDFLAGQTRPYASSDTAPRIVVGTPSGQFHEMGAVMVAALVAHLGWRPVYLGTGLPAVELAGAAVQNGARAVCLSLIYPADDPRLAEELTTLRRLLPREVEIIVGGRAAVGYDEALTRIGALRPHTFDELARRLEELRR